MRTREEIQASAVDQVPFSNGTEGYGWMGSHCDVCVHDADFRRTGDGGGCPILYVAMGDQMTPTEWVDGPRDEQGRYGISTKYTCTEFRDERDRDANPEPEPGPPQVSEDQLDLFGLIVEKQILPAVAVDSSAVTA